MDKYTKISRNPEQLFSIIDEEVVMLSVANGEYYNLNSVGSYIWKKLEIPLSIGDLVEDLCDSFDVEEQLCMKDTIDFLERMIEKNIIQTVDG